jgi:hypothetical protein
MQITSSPHLAHGNSEVVQLIQVVQVRHTREPAHSNNNGGACHIGCCRQAGMMQGVIDACIAANQPMSKLR